MADLAVRQPHLGSESIALLHRIVNREDAGLPQDDIEPYLLVRLLRCGYVRRKQAESPLFTATPAGIERARFEALQAGRRQQEFERRETIRARIQVMVDRLERDRIALPAAPALRDLPLYRERQVPFLPQPPRPRALAAPDVANRMNRAACDTPEDVLRAIREAELRSNHECALPVPEHDPPPVTDPGGVAIVHVGRLPEPPPLAPPQSPADSPPDDARPAIVVTEVIDPRQDQAAPNDPGEVPGTAADRATAWTRAALAATVAAAVILIADPIHRHDGPSVHRALHIAQAQMHAPAPQPGEPAPVIAAARPQPSTTQTPAVEHQAAAIAGPRKLPPSQPRPSMQDKSDRRAQATNDQPRKTIASGTAIASKPAAPTPSDSQQPASMAQSEIATGRPHSPPIHATPVRARTAAVDAPAPAPRGSMPLTPTLVVATIAKLVPPPALTIVPTPVPIAPAHAVAPPARHPYTHSIPRHVAPMRVTAKPRAGEEQGDVMVDRLNKLSLEAALHGRTFIPPGVHRASVTPPGPPLDSALP